MTVKFAGGFGPAVEVFGPYADVLGLGLTVVIVAAAWLWTHLKGKQRQVPMRRR
jgi:hypothetical protein